EDSAKCEGYLKTLEAAVKKLHIDPQTGPENERKKPLKFTEVMEIFERKCWFPQVHAIPLGILPGPDFIKFMKWGMQLKDVGAQSAHGEFSHRLQWHCIMYDATEGFTKAIGNGYKNSAFRLACLTGRLATPSATGKNLWGHLLDKGGHR